MKTFRIPVVYQMYGHVSVEAESMDEAVNDIENGGSDIKLPTDAEYLEGSFEVDHSGLSFFT